MELLLCARHCLRHIVVCPLSEGNGRRKQQNFFKALERKTHTIQQGNEDVRAPLRDPQALGLRPPSKHQPVSFLKESSAEK